MANAQRQRGVALVTALLVTALAATAATAMLTREHLAVRRTQNLLSDGQAWQYALAGEAVAIAALVTDRANNDADGPGDRWHGTLPPVNEGAATIRVNIEDLQGRLNVNAIAGDAARRERTVAILERLVALENPQAPATGIGAAVADWIDADQQVSFPGGAEDDYYTRQEPPYRTAGAPMAGASELRLVRGVDAASATALRDRVTALPVDAEGLNLNTAPAALLQALHPAVAEADVDALLAARAEQALSSVGDALAVAPSMAQPELPRSWLQVDSQYFLITARVELGRARKTLRTVVHRPASGPVQILYRGTAPP